MNKQILKKKKKKKKNFAWEIWLMLFPSSSLSSSSSSSTITLFTLSIFSLYLSLTIFQTSTNKFCFAASNSSSNVIHIDTGNMLRFFTGPFPSLPLAIFFTPCRQFHRRIFIRILSLWWDKQVLRARGDRFLVSNCNSRDILPGNKFNERMYRSEL